MLAAPQPNLETYSYFLITLALGFTQGVYSSPEITSLRPLQIALAVNIFAYLTTANSNELRFKEMAMLLGFGAGFVVGTLFTPNPLRDAPERHNHTFSFSSL